MLKFKFLGIVLLVLGSCSKTMLKQPAPTQSEEVAAVRNNFSHTTFYFWDGSDGHLFRAGRFYFG